MVKTRILIIENSIEVTGALKSITRTAYDLRGFFDFQFIVPYNSKGSFWIEGKGFSIIHELPMKEISKRFSSLVLYIPFLVVNAFRIRRIVRRENISILHVNDLYNLLPIMLHLFGNKVPYVCHIRFLPNRFPKWLFNFWLRLNLKYAYKVVAVSQSVLSQLPSHQKLILVHDELPIEERYPVMSDLHGNKSAFTFLYLSNFTLGKGQNYALEAFIRIHKEIPDWKLRFVGSDMGLKKNKVYKESLMEKASATGIWGKTEWHGFTEDVELEYKQADVVLNFSESESFSMTCLESLFYGRPVIATGCGGPAEIIDHKLTGILVENRNIDAMAEAMKQLALNEKLRVEMGMCAHKVVSEKFSVAKTSFRLKEVYDQILLCAS